MTPPALVTLTTDFGLADPYVAAMKGVILSIAPEATIVDVSHAVAPQHIAGAGFMLESVLPYFPPHAVHVVVVDPGVGTERFPIAVQTPGGFLVGPDNGCMIPGLVALSSIDAATGRLAMGARAVRIDNPQLVRTEVSTTFHGRDIFSPVAAHLATGVPLEEVGPALGRLTLLPAADVVKSAGSVGGEIVHVDRFGNLISNIPGEVMPAAPEVKIGHHTLRGLVKSYQERDLAALIGSTGYLEIAARNGSAAKLLGLGPGTAVVVQEAE